MIKRVVYSLLWVLMMFGMTTCGKRVIIPDETLADIFHDAFIVNSYIGEEHINIDSLHIYEPIFEKYGYTTEDVLHTVRNFSQRKSVRLGSIVEIAIKRLEQESRDYEKMVIILDTIRSVAIRSSTREIYRDTLIVAKKRADSTRLQIVITPAPRGEYTIKYGYTCTDVDKYPRGMEFYFTDENGYKTNRTTQTLREKGMINRTLVARNDNRSLVLNLGKYTSLDKGTTKQKGKKKKRTLPPKLQDFKVENLVVTHKLKEEEAIDSLFNRYVDVKIFADGFLIQKDSLALSPDSTRVSTEASIDD